MSSLRPYKYQVIIIIASIYFLHKTLFKTNLNTFVMKNNNLQTQNYSSKEEINQIKLFISKIIYYNIKNQPRIKLFINIKRTFHTLYISCHISRLL